MARAHLVVFLEARDSTLAGRLAGRGRADDGDEVVANRLRVFREHSDTLKRSFGRRCKVVRDLGWAWRRGAGWLCPDQAVPKGNGQG